MRDLVAFDRLGVLLPPEYYSPTNEWHVVRLELDGLDPLNRPIMTNQRKIKIETWLMEQIKSQIIKCYDHDRFGQYAFIEKQDALLFKLRWT